MQYIIRIKGHLSPAWSGWLEEPTIVHNEAGETILQGNIPDQAALFGILNRIQAFNLRLVAVTLVEDSPPDSSFDE